MAAGEFKGEVNRFENTRESLTIVPLKIIPKMFVNFSPNSRLRSSPVYFQWPSRHLWTSVHWLAATLTSHFPPKQFFLLTSLLFETILVRISDTITPFPFVQLLNPAASTIKTSLLTNVLVSTSSFSLSALFLTPVLDQVTPYPCSKASVPSVPGATTSFWHWRSSQLGSSKFLCYLIPA